MNGLKAFGERIASRNPDRQTAEIQSHIAIMNGDTHSAPPRSQTPAEGRAGKRHFGL